MAGPSLQVTNSENPLTLLVKGVLAIDARGWSTIAMFSLVLKILDLIDKHPALANNELFKTAVILLLGTGGFGLTCSFLWGGSKGTAGAIDTVNAMARQNTTAGNALPAGPVVTAPAQSSVQVNPPAVDAVETKND